MPSSPRGDSTAWYASPAGTLKPSVKILKWWISASIDSPRGEIGCYIASDGSPTPYRMHMRAPSFANIQALPHMLRGGLVADAVAVISSVDPVLGDVDR